ncbi:hypothetical protein [Mucilaginibacter sp. BT774]|uniref:hypothetical protein n=1 Tax=Mucilaginibacter sp. BT774 TaxID=3062276 RepID=UPI0026752B42|nr:hypothetical protein [Mucilaginibacter sp. BT774]MDO3629140.1 hypothetical protein [Mucilaginibacter sp. BT774]
MLKRLLFTSLYLLFFMPVFAQTHEDSMKNNAVTDTIVKHLAVDTTAKKQTDTAKHAAIDSVVQVHPADSAVKHAVVDSASVRYKPAIKTAKKSPAKTAPKPAAVADSGIKHSTVKTINDLRYNAYLKGDDLDGMALTGDLNHFPSPDSVLKYKKQLDLSPIQVGQLTKLSNELHRKKIEMGTNIIRNEKMLDSLFHSRYIDEGSLIFYTNRAGLYFGEMKGAILMACYNAEKFLTPAQIKKLETLEKNK